MVTGDSARQGEVVTEEAVHPPRRRSRLRLVRRAVGVAGLVAVGLAGVGFLLGAWNPWHLVALRYSVFGNPMMGLLLVPAGALVAQWLALPVDNEARQRGRIAGRAAAAVLAVAGLFGWGVFGDHFSFEAEEIARSADGSRAVALARDHDRPPNAYVRIWTGSGLTTTEVGDLGRTCGPVSVRFLSADLVEVDSSYGTWRFALDPATGAPLEVFGPRCADGPVPAGAAGRG